MHVFGTRFVCLVGGKGWGSELAERVILRIHDCLAVLGVVLIVKTTHMMIGIDLLDRVLVIVLLLHFGDVYGQATTV